MVNWWEYPTNYSNNTIVDGAGKMFLSYPSSIIGGYLGPGIVLLVWMVTFTLSSSKGTSASLITFCFISGIISILLFAAGMVNIFIPITLITIAIIGAIGTKATPGEGL